LAVRTREAAYWQLEDIEVHSVAALVSSVAGRPPPPWP
jgi:hypothetical protein